MQSELKMDGGRPLPYDRETLGRFVREAWVRWATTQPDPKPSWLLSYDELSEADKEADRQIGEAVARWTLIGDSALTAALSDKQAVEVKIKQLVWESGIAFTPFGSYTVSGQGYDDEEEWHWTFHCYPYGDPDETTHPTSEAAKAAAQADYEQRIRSALVDVPAVEPVGEAGEMPGSNGGFTMAVFKASDVPLGTKLYTSPLITREGEDSAEVSIDQSLLQAAINELRVWKVEKGGDDQVVLNLEAALAATRSGSATSAKGCAE